jgi:hypothetical protein
MRSQIPSSGSRSTYRNRFKRLVAAQPDRAWKLRRAAVQFLRFLLCSNRSPILPQCRMRPSASRRPRPNASLRRSRRTAIRGPQASPQPSGSGPDRLVCFVADGDRDHRRSLLALHNRKAASRAAYLVFDVAGDQAASETPFRAAR